MLTCQQGAHLSCRPEASETSGSAEDEELDDDILDKGSGLMLSKMPFNGFSEVL